jgi:hypothetical protein
MFGWKKKNKMSKAIGKILPPPSSHRFHSPSLLPPAFSSSALSPLLLARDDLKSRLEINIQPQAPAVPFLLIPRRLARAFSC